MKYKKLLVRPREDRELLGGISRSTLWRYQKSGSFPSPVMMNHNILGWELSDIKIWIDENKQQKVAA